MFYSFIVCLYKTDIQKKTKKSFILSKKKKIQECVFFIFINRVKMKKNVLLFIFNNRYKNKKYVS